MGDSMNTLSTFLVNKIYFQKQWKNVYLINLKNDKMIKKKFSKTRKNGTLFLIKIFKVIILKFYYSLFFLKNK